MTSNYYKFEYLDDIIDSVKNPQLANVEMECQEYDPGLNKTMVTRQFKKKGLHGKEKIIKKKVPLISYSSIHRIRHAISGTFFEYPVGSKHENSFFKVKNCGVHGAGSKNRDYCLFFYSPEEFEGFYDTTLPTNVKEKWHKKQIKEPEQEQEN